MLLPLKKTLISDDKSIDMMTAPLTLKTAINQFYQTVGYHSDWSEVEQAYCLMAEGKVIGSVKVESSHGVSMLRGMYLDQAYHRKGLGTELIKFIEPVLDQAVSYCLPFDHLEGFYRITVEQLPEFIKQRFLGYLAKGYQIVPMQRDRAS